MKKFSGIEKLVILTITVIIARPIVWFVWGDEIRGKEKSIIEAMGLNYGMVRIGIFTVVFAVLLFWGGRDWKKRKATKRQASKLKLPDE